MHLSLPSVNSFSSQAEANHINQELKALIAKRDTENARLRDQREQQAAELNERKQRDNVKLASMKELQSLAETRSASRANQPTSYRIDVRPESHCSA